MCGEPSRACVVAESQKKLTFVRGNDFPQLVLVHGSGKRDGRPIGKMVVTLWSVS